MHFFIKSAIGNSKAELPISARLIFLTDCFMDTCFRTSYTNRRKSTTIKNIVVDSAIYILLNNVSNHNRQSTTTQITVFDLVKSLKPVYKHCLKTDNSK